MRPAAVVVDEQRPAPKVVDEPCAVRSCPANRLEHSLYCPACDARTARAPSSLLVRAWAADAAEMPRVLADMTRWLEETRRW
jgi:hypothetical protein